MLSSRPAAPHARHRRLRLPLVGLLAAVMAVAGLATNPHPVAAGSAKVVIVVGPAGSATSNYIYNAKKLAAQARGYGASVIEIYSPYATWSRVRTAAQGANVLIYLGHGNGWPSPYGPYQGYSKDGMGLNATSGNGNSNVKYWGEYYIARDINLASNAVVILNRLCYASGNSEWGSANPTKSTAIARVDNYGAGFIRANARAVFAEAIGGASYILYGLFRTNRTMLTIFNTAPNHSGAYDFTFRSSRTSGMTAAMDPSSPGRYYRSLIGTVGMTSSTWH